MITLLLLGVVGLLDLAVVLKLAHAFRLLKIPEDANINDAGLPTVSVCIAARNETHAMTQCLERVVASEYPKLEIIVLDDGSRDDTSLLIKSFAHAGVRFVEGKALPDGWLGKNYAQSLLAREASGKFVFFMDVDTLIDRHTLLRAVSYAQTHQSKMVSFIPIRNDYFQVSTLLTTMRHFWTLMRFRPVKPRASSNAWLIDRTVLMDEFASDTSLQQSVEVETTIARKLAASHEYRLALSNTWLGLRYEKRWSSQVETSIRLLYPQNGKHLFNVIGIAVLLLIGLLPYVLVWWQAWALAVIIIQFVITYYYLTHVWQRYRIIGALLLPITIIQEIILLVTSTYRYKFGTITWKGRPIRLYKTLTNTR
ncbi:MAG: glycosyl transferase family protein [Candidatus Saccharibacteria bacterium]|nr:glycosyl transferase family protein [Candidatus Saccharibacteria bacterium]